jgi:hypothetical protein
VGKIAMRVNLWAAVVMAGSLACGSGSGSAPGSEAEGEGDTPGASSRRVSGADGDEAQYRIVETPEGMAVEAVSADQVQTISCPARTCPGLCDECAQAACRASGGEASACGALAAQCTNSCACGSFGGDRCGFPVCAENPRICYIEASAPASAPGTPIPGDPEPAPDPFASGGSPASPSGSGAARPEL